MSTDKQIVVVTLPYEPKPFKAEYVGKSDVPNCVKIKRLTGRYAGQVFNVDANSVQGVR